MVHEEETDFCVIEGYGDLAATTFWGRLFTMIYALVGIPMVITILNDWGTIMFQIVDTPDLQSSGLASFHSLGAPSGQHMYMYVQRLWNGVFNTGQAAEKHRSDHITYAGKVA
ncbi:hypothetical protein ANCCAN_16563 [Ancylostoma caninum]|uniref:Potassium channel domain-containing protein n=1 Tax=Ancylostoma caninum TaxID=29170 RepID=A0A368G3B8_ANCCA|nr:hypothetical protein ANCCAN_16563 [Ancylostoma caninum]